MQQISIRIHVSILTKDDSCPGPEVWVIIETEPAELHRGREHKHFIVRSENGKVDGYFLLLHCFYSVQGWIWNMNPTWAKYSSAILSAHSRQRARGRAGLLTSAHLISILLITTGSIAVSPPGTLEPCQQNINVILNLVIKHQINTRLISENIRKLYQRILRT